MQNHISLWHCLWNRVHFIQNYTYLYHTQMTRPINKPIFHNRVLCNVAIQRQRYTLQWHQWRDCLFKSLLVLTTQIKWKRNAAVSSGFPLQYGTVSISAFGKWYRIRKYSSVPLTGLAIRLAYRARSFGCWHNNRTEIACDQINQLGLRNRNNTVWSVNSLCMLYSNNWNEISFVAKCIIPLSLLCRYCGCYINDTFKEKICTISSHTFPWPLF